MHKGSRSSTFLLADPWYNRIAQNDQGDGCAQGAIGPVIVENLPKGVAFTYPAFSVERYIFRDVHDPQSTAPIFSPPLAFEVNANCSYTASQQNGHKVIVPAPVIFGTVE
jgi:hypothetical protein